MSKHEGRRFDRRTAERLLGGTSAEVPGALAGLLAAAAAPPHDGELTGERAATAAFVAATRHVHVPRQRNSTVRGMLAKLITVKVAAATAAIFTVGGVATAAATGHLSRPDVGPPATVSPSGHPAAGVATASTAIRGDNGSLVLQGHSPSPSLVGLCHAYTAGAGPGHGKALDGPAFTVLIDSAGGRDDVAAYCATVLSAAAAASTGVAADARGGDSRSDGNGAQGDGSPGNGSSDNSAPGNGAQSNGTDGHGNPGNSASGHENGGSHTAKSPPTHTNNAQDTHPGKG